MEELPSILKMDGSVQLPVCVDSVFAPLDRESSQEQLLTEPYFNVCNVANTIASFYHDCQCVITLKVEFKVDSKRILIEL